MPAFLLPCLLSFLLFAEPSNFSIVWPASVHNLARNVVDLPFPPSARWYGPCVDINSANEQYFYFVCVFELVLYFEPINPKKTYWVFEISRFKTLNVSTRKFLSDTKRM